MAAKDEAPEDENENAEGAESGDAAEAYEEGEKSKKKLILLVILPLLVLAGAGAGLYFSGFLDKWIKPAATEGEHAEAAPAEGEHGAPAEVDEHGVPTAGAQFLKIPDMTVNLNSEDGTPRYLRLSVQLELKNGIDLQAVEKVMPRVVDQFQTYLRELRVRDLRGSAGIYRLQAELLARVNQAAYPTEVQDVLFQEILIQ